MSTEGRVNRVLKEVPRLVDEVRKQAEEIERLRGGLELIAGMPRLLSKDDFQRGLSHAAGVAMGILSNGASTEREPLACPGPHCKRPNCTCVCHASKSND